MAWRNGAMPNTEVYFVRFSSSALVAALDVFRRRKIRLAGAEVGHVNSLRLQPLRFLKDDHRLRNADAIHAVCKVEYLFHFSPGGRFH
jgi:hypothetical protein